MCPMPIGMETQNVLGRSDINWENAYTQAVNSPTRGDALLDVYLVCLKVCLPLAALNKGSVTNVIIRSRMGRKLLSASGRETT
jgi:hypothetical protein